jgi:hypothetical protein
MKTILISFDNVAEREQFIKVLQEHASDPVIGKALTTLRLDPAIKTGEERQAALYVSGTRLAEGTMPTIEKMFKQECAAHHAKVEIKEFKNGEWHRIRVRTTS